MLITMLEKLWRKLLRTEPKIINIICPQCRKTWMCKYDERTYFCYACSHILFERQVKELVNKIP